MPRTKQQLKDTHDPTAEVLSLRKDVQVLQRALKEEKEERGKSEVFLKQLLETVTICDPIKVVYKPRRSKSGSHIASAVLHLSDWHIGKCVRGYDTNDFNAFNFATAIARVDDLIAQHMRQVDMWRGLRNTHVEECVLIATSDMINGALRKGDIATNEFHECEQTAKAAELFSALVMALAPHFKTMRVEWAVPDNHSRLGKRVESAQPTNCFNYLIGYIIQCKLSEQKNVTVNLHPGLVGVTKVQNLTYLIRHGHDITPGQGSYGGVPYYNIDRYLATEALAALGKPDFAFDKLVMGHYHVAYDGPLARIGLSLSGTDYFDRSRGRKSVAGQGGWLVHSATGEESVNRYILGHINCEPAEYPAQQTVSINY